MANPVSTFVLMLFVCELHLGLFVGKATAQTFITQPVDVDLTLGQDVYEAISCSFTKANPSDVIGWVVNGTVRISNDHVKLPSAIDQALGDGAASKIQIYLNEDTKDPGTWVYDIDFFAATEVLLGSYMCQLCTDVTCGTVLAVSSTAQVSMEYEPTSPPSCSPSSTTRVTLGESVTVSCSSDPGIPTVQLDWLRNTQVMTGQAQPVLSNGLLYNNHTFEPTVTDDDPGVTFNCSMTSASRTLACSITPFILISTPRVSVIPPSQGIEPGSRGTYTCSVISDTNTPIVEYVWNIPDVSPSRLSYGSNGRTVTVSGITVADHEKVIECQVTDAESMQGSGEYVILVEGEVVPSNLPTVPAVASTVMGSTNASSTPASGLAPAVIIAIVLAGLVLLCILLGGIWFCRNKRKQGKQTLPPTIVRNDLSPTTTSPLKSEKAFNFSNVDAKQPDPDVIPKGSNERPVDVDNGGWWKGSDAPNGHAPSNNDPYNYNPAYDDKADPAELDFKVPLDDQEYGSAGYGYPAGDDYGYPREQDGKYNDTKYMDDGYDKQNYAHREYGDGRQDSYPQGYGDEYNPSNYDTVYGDEYQAPPAQYGSGYEPYPDRMPDGSEGYEPPPEYNGQSYGAPTDYGRPEDYSGVADYSNQPKDMGYDAQPGEYNDDPSNYDYQQPSSGTLPGTYNDGLYGDQYNAPYDPERAPDGGAPDGGDYDYNYPQEGEAYTSPYSGEPANYNEAGYPSSSYQQDPSFTQAYPDQYQNDQYPDDQYTDDQYPSDQYQSGGQPQSEPYYDPAEEVSATSNPSYV